MPGDDHNYPGKEEKRYVVKAQCRVCDCPFCDGTGKTDCDNCRGDGCKYCDTTGTQICPECEGTGKRTWLTQVKSEPKKPAYCHGRLGCGTTKVEILRVYEVKTKR